MTTISFMLANYAARPLNYRMERWAQGEQATSGAFRAAFVESLEAYLSDVSALGFAAVDLWKPMFDPRWISDEQLESAADLLDDYVLEAVSFAGWLGEDADEFERTCEIAAALGAPLLVGSTRAERGFVLEALQKYGLAWAYENEPEHSAAEILASIGDEDVYGVCADVGWFATHGMDAAETLRQLAPRLLHVHLKDVRRVGYHETCRFGDGIVPLERCVRVLQEVGYAGAVSIEHETAGYDPSEDIRASLALLERWLA